jgi:lipid II:glycine glycyltransferase (peptidoglycan interpeptide bridge formation enzyme)
VPRPTSFAAAPTVREITAEQHLEWIQGRAGSTSFLQTPAWAGVKAEWGHVSLGWFEASELVGTGLVLLRRIPRTPWSLAYLPEGPVLDWHEQRPIADLTVPLVGALKARRAFSVKMGPPLVARRWHAATIKDAIASGDFSSLADVPADVTDHRAIEVGAQLRASGWSQPESDGAGFGDVQPRYVFQLPLAGRTLDDVFAGFNQEWRRNVRKAAKAGVEVVEGDEQDLPDFHRVYVETAARDGFTPRGLPYFQRMWRVMRAEDPQRIRLFLARHEGEVLAATTLVTVGSHAWYSYGASTTASRDLRPSNAVQWAMIQAAHDAGAAVYDLRGISGTLDQNHPLFGLIRFKLGTGGEAAEYLGEFDLPINALLHKAVGAYLARR